MKDDEKKVDPIETEETVVEEPAVEEPVVEEPAVEEPVTEESAVEEPVAEEPAAATPVSEAGTEGQKSGFFAKVKKLGKKGMIAAAAAVVAVAIIVVAAFAGTSPAGLVGNGIGNSIKAVGENPVVSLFADVMNGGSTEISVDLDTMTEALGPYFMLDGTASAKVYTDISANKMAVTAGIRLDQSEALDASLFISEDSISVASEWLLGEDAYGVDLKKFSQNFENSEFGIDGEYSLGVELPKEDANLTAEMKQCAEDSEKLSKAVVTEILKIVEENANIDKEGAKLTFGDEEVKTTAVSVEMDYEQLFAVVSQTLEYIRADKNIRSYLEDYAEYILTGIEGYSVDPADADAFVEELYENLDIICEERMDFLADQFEESDVSIQVTFHITKSGKQMVGIEFEAEADGEKVKGSVYAGPDLKKVEEVSFRLSVDGETYRATYAVKTNDSKEFHSELKVRADNETVFNAEILWDKKDGDFEIEASDGWDEFVVEGSLEQSGKNTILVLKSVSADGDKVKLNATVAFTPSDKMPSEPAYTDVLTMSAEEIEDVLGELAEVVQELLFGFYW